MAHIVRFSVSGLAGRSGTLERSLDRHINIFFGLNGSGKTSLLKILDSALERSTSQLVQVPFESAEVDIYSRDFDSVYTHRLTAEDVVQLHKSIDSVSVLSQSRLLSRPHTELTDAVEWRLEPSLPPQARSGGWSHGYLPITRMYLPSAEYAMYQPTPGFTEPQLNALFATSLERAWSDYSTVVQKEVSTAQADGLARILGAVLTGEKHVESSTKLQPLEAYDRVKQFLQRQGSAQPLPNSDTFVRRYKSHADLRSVVTDIDEVEKRVERAYAPRKNLQNLIEKMFIGGKVVRFSDTQITVELADRSPLDLRLLSSGEKQVLRVLVEALRAGQNSLIIDEPELSLHVDWQQHLVAAINELNPEAQLILATHSPEIMAEVSDANIFQL